MTTLSRSDSIRLLRDCVFSICSCFCCSNNNSRILSSADPLEKKYNPKARLKIRIEMMIEESRGFPKWDKKGNDAKAYYIFLNKHVEIRIKIHLYPKSRHLHLSIQSSF